MPYIAEISRYLHMIIPHCGPCGIDIGSQGNRSIPWFWQCDLPEPQFSTYCGGAPAKGPIQIRAFGEKLPIDSNSLDTVLSSHLLEDFQDWLPVLKEWVRVLKPGGKLIVLIPDKQRWAQAIDAGQPPNSAHKHEGQVGELTSYALVLGLDVVCDQLTDCHPGDYTIIFIAIKN